MLDMWRPNGFCDERKLIKWMVFLVKTLEVHTRHIEIYISTFFHQGF